MKYIPVALTLIFVTYGQLIIKHGVGQLGPFPGLSFSPVLKYGFKALTNLSILSGLAAAVVASFCWMAALSKCRLSDVYPILSLNFVLVPACAALFFKESMSVLQMVGIAIIVIGVFVFAKGI